VPKPFYFPFSISYWFPSKHEDMTDSEGDKIVQTVDLRNFESEPQTQIGIKVRNLRKEFGGIGSRRKTAVENVSLNIYSGQITVLLGHNGAGKTTTMNMITGIFPPTSGTVYVDGYNIKTETNKARKSLGLCPQV
jgi:ATP-binding cassette subfamily A (ABC1) protein 3